jgi:hypothetical protein
VRCVVVVAYQEVHADFLHVAIREEVQFFRANGDSQGE